MKRVHGIVVIALLLFTAPAWAEGAKPQGQDPPQQEAEKSPVPEPAPGAAGAQAKPHPPSAVRYVPPRRGSPRTKVGAGVRGFRTQPRPIVLAPPHTALSASDAPTLFWHIDTPMNEGAHALFTLSRVGDIEPLAEIELGTRLAGGMHRVALADHGIALEPDVEYQWAISIVVDRDGRGMDQIDQSHLVHVAAEVPDVSAAAWAAASFWHDALARAVAAYAADPESAAARADLTALLVQGGLESAIPLP